MAGAGRVPNVGQMSLLPGQLVVHGSDSRFKAKVSGL